MRNSLKLPIAALAAIGATLLRPAAGATDGVFISSGAPEAQTAPSYESDYVAEARQRGRSDGTPEADARPGEGFFLRAVDAYKRRDYTFAVQMYEVAASWAYKPAEYNLGVMYARGEGVPVDLPRAMAWMALAAERNDTHYVDGREAVYASLTREQFDEANVIWRELKKTCGDEVALRRAKTRWAQVRAGMTGSRVGSVGNLSVGMPNANGGDPSSQKPSAGLPPGVKTVRTTAATAAEITMGSGVDGSIAYRQLRESDNPYDPKFDRSAAGTAIVGPPEPVKTDAAKDTQPLGTDKPDPAGGQR